MPDGLDAYLDAGDPPVLITMGTSAAASTPEVFELAARAVQAAGHRPLLLVGNQRNRDALRSRHDAWAFAPLPRVLPRCRAVIHSGGQGTTAATLCAGLPAVVLPQLADQHWHASRIEQLGAGEVVAWRRRSHDRIRDALARVSSDDVRTRAARLGQELSAMDGPANAADHIERVLAGDP